MKQWRLIAPVAALIFLWFELLNHLRIEWTLNPQYNYGWAVPFLCLYLIWQKALTAPTPSQPNREHELVEPKSARDGIRTTSSAAAHEISGHASRITHHASLIHLGSLLLLALLYLPTRLIQEANPEWRMVSWALALEVTGLTLLLLQMCVGRQLCTAIAFPVLFFLVAVPWPTVVESPLVRALTSFSTATTVELLGWVGIPAVQRANVIEIATGVVGIDEACSGIRSLQATLMLSLFFGQLYRLPLVRRLTLVLTGFVLAMVLNIGRTLLLVAVGSHKGIAAIPIWHDPAGVTILLVCFFALWLFSLRLRNKGACDLAASRNTEHASRITHHASLPASYLTCALLSWLLLVELSVHWWYRSHETPLAKSTGWSVALPRDNQTLHELSIPEPSRRLLRFDDAKTAMWNDEGARWQLIFLHWRPGKTASHLAQGHTPEVCLTAAGRELVSTSELDWLEAGGLRLPFRSYAIANDPPPAYVFYCLWDDRKGSRPFKTVALTYSDRLQLALGGQRNPGQRSLEISVRGFSDFDAARAAVARQLQTLIRLDPS